VTVGQSSAALRAPLGEAEEPLSLGSFRGGSSAAKSDANQTRGAIAGLTAVNSAIVGGLNTAGSYGKSRFE
jgi:hypothetical protein